jgi:hypothetical protein
MDITGYLKRKMAILSLALARVEKDALNQVSDALGSEGALEQSYHQGQLADALLKGEITYEVKELRWRMYKVLNATENLRSRIVGYDEDGLPITETTEHTRQLLRDVNVDKEDPHKVELVIYNHDVVKSTTEALNNEKLTIHKEEASEREDRHNLVVRDVDGENKLLEFYISQYPDGFDRKTRFLISEIKKSMRNSRASDILDITRVGFVTNKSLGAPNGMEYIYEINKFHKIVEFNGHYVIKFMATPIVNGEFIFSQHKLEDLEEKYRTKAPKKLEK